MSTRQIVKGENDYRLVFRAGLVWLLREDGTVAHVSSWRPCCPAHVSMAARKLASVTTADWMARRTA